MPTIHHERPGVYSSYDATTAILSSPSAQAVGLLTQLADADNTVYSLFSYAQCVESFSDAPLTLALLRLLFLNGVSTVYLVPVEDSSAEAYADAYLALQSISVPLLLCDSVDIAVQQSLRNAILSDALQRRERLAVFGLPNACTVSQLLAHATALNTERVVLCPPAVYNGATSSLYASAAFAALLATETDVALPLHGVALQGLSGVEQNYSESEIDTLVQGGVIPLECWGGAVTAVRCVTSRSLTDGVADSTWRELTTIRIVDHIVPAVRSLLHNQFTRSKNTAQTRGAIRSAVLIFLENKKSEQIIDSYQQVTVAQDENDPTACLVSFSFAVAHGLNRIFLTAHITV